MFRSYTLETNQEQVESSVCQTTPVCLTFF